MIEKGEVSRKNIIKKIETRKRAGNLLTVIGCISLIIFIFWPIVLLAIIAISMLDEEGTPSIGSGGGEALTCFLVPYFFSIAIAIEITRAGTKLKNGVDRERVIVNIGAVIFISLIIFSITLVVFYLNPFSIAAIIFSILSLIYITAVIMLVYTFFYSWSTYGLTSAEGKPRLANLPPGSENGPGQYNENGMMEWGEESESKITRPESVDQFRFSR